MQIQFVGFQTQMVCPTQPTSGGCMDASAAALPCRNTTTKTRKACWHATHLVTGAADEKLPHLPQDEHLPAAEGQRKKLREARSIARVRTTLQTQLARTEEQVPSRCGQRASACTSSLAYSRSECLNSSHPQSRAGPSVRRKQEKRWGILSSADPVATQLSSSSNAPTGAMSGPGIA